MSDLLEKRRRWLRLAASLPFTSSAAQFARATQTREIATTVPATARPSVPSDAPALSGSPIRARVRPTDPDWPAPATWDELREQIGDALVAVKSPWNECRPNPDGAICHELLKTPQNPYLLGDDLALTQTYGWVDAWTTSPSVWAVAARNTADVVATVNFARLHRLKLVVKGGGHSYQGTSNGPDSLLIWTRRLNDIQMHDAFVPRGSDDSVPATRAVSIGGGAIWSQVYDVVSTQGGGYVQGGGCMTVGVAGLVQSGGFGSFSKAFGTASSNLLEAEIVTANGQVRIVNSATDPDLFWALKGGGGGSFGVVTRLTLRVHPLPERFGAVNFVVKASSNVAFRRLVGMTVEFFSQSLVGPNWGEQIRFQRNNSMRVSMVFQGMNRSEAQAVWAPFFAAVDDLPTDFNIEFAPFKVVSTAARDFWAPTFIKRALGFIARDDRPDAPATNVFWPGDQSQVGQVLHGYQSAWLPASLLRDDHRTTLADALFEASRHASLALHFNKGLAGAPASVLETARETAINPGALAAFALVITAAKGPPAYPGVAGHEPDVELGRREALAVRATIDVLRARIPVVGAYLPESDFFQSDWQHAFWGENYPRLLSIKDRVDPHGLFIVHHGVGSERWSEDGFTPRDEAKV